MNLTITYWTGEISNVKGESMRQVFESVFGGPVRSTGYNKNGVWMSVDEGLGYVMNRDGDHTATINIVPLADARSLGFIDVMPVPMSEIGDGVGWMRSLMTAPKHVLVEWREGVKLAYADALASNDLEKSIRFGTMIEMLDARL